MLLISDKLVELVERHSDVIIKRWITRLTIDPTTSAYNQKHIDFIGEKAKEILDNLGKWVSYDTTKGMVGERYAAEGMEMFKMGIPLCEIIRAMYTLRRILWLFVMNESAFESAFELHQMIELSDRVILFFDRAEYYLIRGYHEEMYKKIKKLGGAMKAEELNKIFFTHSFYNK